MVVHITVAFCFEKPIKTSSNGYSHMSPILSEEMENSRDETISFFLDCHSLLRQTITQKFDKNLEVWFFEADIVG